EHLWLDRRAYVALPRDVLVMRMAAAAEDQLVLLQRRFAGALQRGGVHLARVANLAAILHHSSIGREHQVRVELLVLLRLVAVGAEGRLRFAVVITAEERAVGFGRLAGRVAGLFRVVASDAIEVPGGRGPAGVDVVLLRDWPADRVNFRHGFYAVVAAEAEVRDLGGGDWEKLAVDLRVAGFAGF